MAIVEKLEQLPPAAPVKVTADDVARILTGFRSLYCFKRWIVVAGVKWGMHIPWECDLLACSKNGFLHEIEIKVAAQDLRNDRKKRKFQLQLTYFNRIRSFSYAAPESVWAKTGFDAVPPHVGIIVIDPSAKRARDRARFVRHPKVNKKAIKLDAAGMFQLARLGAMRYWSRKR